MERLFSIWLVSAFTALLHHHLSPIWPSWTWLFVQAIRSPHWVLFFWRAWDRFFRPVSFYRTPRRGACGWVFTMVFIDYFKDWRLSIMGELARLMNLHVPFRVNFHIPYYQSGHWHQKPQHTPTVHFLPTFCCSDYFWSSSCRTSNSSINYIISTHQYLKWGVLL